MAETPTADQEQRAKWDLALADLEKRAEEIRQLKTIDIDMKLRLYRLEPWKIALTTVSATTAVFVAGGVVGGLLVRMLTGH